MGMDNRPSREKYGIDSDEDTWPLPEANRHGTP